MRSAPRLAAPVVVAAAWLCATAPVPLILRALAGFAAVFLLPGLMLGRWLDRRGASTAEEPVRALVLSIAMVGTLGLLCYVLGRSVTTLNVALLVLTAMAAVAGRPQAPERSQAEGRTLVPASSLAIATIGAIAVLTTAAVVLAAIDVNIARDRMWYAAYVTKLGGGEVLDWRDPVLGTGRIVWRFAGNAWLLALGAWSALAAAPAPWLIERCAPPLLVALVPSAAHAFARALFRNRETALFATLCTVVVLLASGYPYFAPEHTALFIRLVEDKTAALVLLAPFATAVAVRTFAGRDATSRARVFLLAAAMLAVALTHAIVYLVVCISLAACAVWGAASRSLRLRDALPALAVASAVALVPLAVGIGARRDALHAEGPERALAGDVRVDPVVRAHLRMHRLHDLPVGGPIVEPELLADPVLIAATIGIAAAASAPPSIWAAYACSTSIVFLALAFAPFIAPLFGRFVVPWMAYRALWGVPFGLLLAAGLMRAAPAFEGAGDARSRNGALAVVVLLAAIGLSGLPWIRLSESETRLAPDAGTLAVLDAISDLPAHAIVAAAPGLSELIPAYSERPVLAFADRGTTAFAARRGEAGRRLRANAAIVALHGRARRARRRLMVAHGVTHVVLERERCEPGTRTVYADGRFTICEVGAGTLAPLDTTKADLPWTPRPSTGGAEVASAPIADLSSGLSCAPAATPARGYDQWRRESRWSGRFTTLDCSATFPRPVAVEDIVLRGHLPHAREALVYWVRASGADTPCTATGAVEIMRDRSAKIRIACDGTTAVRLRLAASYLPYVNLKELAVYAKRPE